MEDRLDKIHVYIHPIKGTNKTRVFEISNEQYGESRFRDIERNTGIVSMEYSANAGSPNKSDHEGIKRYLVGSARDDLILKGVDLSLRSRLVI